MDNVEELTDQELREALKGYEQAPGPITDSTRNLYRKKLISLMNGDLDGLKQTTVKINKSNLATSNERDQTHHSNVVDDQDDDDDTSDEDYLGEESEESEEDEEDEEEEFEGEDEDDKLIAELEDSDIELSNLSNLRDNLNSTSMSVAPDAVPNRISKGLVLSLISFFTIMFSCYLYSRNDQETLHKLYKSVARYSLVFILLSPVVYIGYRLVRSLRLRRHQEMQRVCGLVNEALELLQSPDNPKGLMPILHIRDTLLTPPERKTKKMTSLWNEAVKFIEEHESRVKVELVNIDGEDFRAWKWIGSRKLI